MILFTLLNPLSYAEDVALQEMDEQSTVLLLEDSLFSDSRPSELSLSEYRSFKRERPHSVDYTESLTHFLSVGIGYAEDLEAPAVYAALDGMNLTPKKLINFGARLGVIYIVDEDIVLNAGLGMSLPSLWFGSNCISFITHLNISYQVDLGMVQPYPSFTIRYDNKAFAVSATVVPTYLMMLSAHF